MKIQSRGSRGLLKLLNNNCNWKKWIFSVRGEQCSLFTPFDFHNNTPVIIVKKPEDTEFKLFKPTAIETKFAEGTQFGIGCPGLNNFFITQQTDEDKKVYGETICTNNEAVKSYFRNFECRSTPTSSIENTKRQCAVKGLIYEVGFYVNGRFYGPIFTICYDPVNISIFYTYHIINGKSIESKWKIL